MPKAIELRGFDLVAGRNRRKGLTPEIDANICERRLRRLTRADLCARDSAMQPYLVLLAANSADQGIGRLSRFFPGASCRVRTKPPARVPASLDEASCRELTAAAVWIRFNAMTVALWKQIFQFTGIIASALALLSGIGIVLTSRIIDQRKDAEIRRLHPRTISDDQRRRIISALGGRTGRIGVSTKMLDGEAADYGDAIAAVFRDAGWEIAPPNRLLLLDLPGYVTLAGTDPSLAALGDIVAAALNAAGIVCRSEHVPEGQVGGPLQPNTLYILVGRKL
jgi:hypothetical protein